MENLYKTPESQVDERSILPQKKLEGLGGWLILVGLGIVFAPLRIIAQMFPVYARIFFDGSWEALTSPGSEAYHPLWAPILVGEIVINACLVLAWLFTVFLFFTKRKIFINWFIGLLGFTVAFIVSDALAVKIVLPNEPVFDLETMREFVRSLIGALIWIPYVLMSKRVKATFVNKIVA